MNVLCSVIPANAGIHPAKRGTGPWTAIRVRDAPRNAGQIESKFWQLLYLIHLGRSLGIQVHCLRLNPRVRQHVIKM